MQKIGVKYIKFLFIGLFLMAITFVTWKKVFGPTPCKPDPALPYCNGVDLPIPLYRQESDYWCWAASVQMCIKCLTGNIIPQCQIATDRVKLHNRSLAISACDCIKSLDSCKYSTIDCNTFVKKLPSDVKQIRDTITAILAPYSLTTSVISINQPNTLNEIKRHLCAGNPIIGIFRNAGYSEHIVVIRGYQIICGETILLINNPLYETVATCDNGCFHGMRVDGCGKNILSFAGKGATGTFDPIGYFAVTP